MQIKDIESNLNSLFLIQSSKRKLIAKDLQNAVMKTLKDLDMENSKLIMVIKIILRVS